jgi:hypothetical protein
MSELESKNGLWVALESGGFSVDPSASGALYNHLPAEEIGELVEGPELVETNLQLTDAFGRTRRIVGANFWELDVKFPLVGFNVSQGDGSAPPADDWFDLIATHVWGAPVLESGEGLGVGSTTSALVLDPPGTGGLQSLHPIYEAGLPTAAPRLQWARSTSASATAPTIDPTLAAAPTTAAIRYATKTWVPTDPGGNTLALVHRKGDTFKTLLGGRITNLEIPETGIGKALYLNAKIRGDRVVVESKGSLPPPVLMPQPEILSLLSPVNFNNTFIETASIGVKFGLKTSEREATASATGRVQHDVIGGEAMVTIKPVYTAATNAFQENGTRAPLLLQFGAGLLAGGRLNGLAFHAAEAQAVKRDVVAAKGIRRNQVQFAINNMGVISGSTRARYYQVVRC